MGTSGYNKRQQISVLRSVPVSTVFFSEQRYTNLDVPGGEFHAAECSAYDLSWALAHRKSESFRAYDLSWALAHRKSESPCGAYDPTRALARSGSEHPQGASRSFRAALSGRTPVIWWRGSRVEQRVLQLLWRRVWPIWDSLPGRARHAIGLLRIRRSFHCRQRARVLAPDP